MEPLVVAVTLLASSLRLMLPILLTAVGAIFSERSGIFNIGLEGMMLLGAFASAWVALAASPVAGLAAGAAAGGLLAVVHAVATVYFRADHVVSGVAVNTLGAALVRIGSYRAFGTATTSPRVEGLPTWSVPGLSGVGWLSPAVSGISPLLVAGLLLVPLAWWVLERTVFGLRLKACGEHPMAADTLGVNVQAMRYSGVLISGLLAGLAGSYLVIELNHLYVEGMTQGRGFIALAATIFGNWTPQGALAASLLFGVAEALSIHARLPGVPYQFFEMVPYLVTMLVLAGVVLRSTPPAAGGRHYARGEE